MAELVLDNDITLRYQRAGQGPTLVFVHGLAASSRFFTGAAEDLARDHDVVLIDLPGHGDSTIGPDPVTLAATAGDVHALVQHLGLNVMMLVGWSLGAIVAFNYLDLCGADRITKLVSVEATPYLLAEDGWEHAAFGGLDAEGAQGITQAIHTDPGTFTKNLISSCFAAGTDPDPVTLHALVAEAAKCSPHALATLWADALGQDWRTRMCRIEVPTLLVHGAKSQVYPTPIGSWLVDAIPNARLEVFENSGHLPFAEEQERFTSAIRGFATDKSSHHRGPRR